MQIYIYYSTNGNSDNNDVAILYHCIIKNDDADNVITSEYSSDNYLDVVNWINKTLSEYDPSDSINQLRQVHLDNLNVK